MCRCGRGGEAHPGLAGWQEVFPLRLLLLPASLECFVPLTNTISSCAAMASSYDKVVKLACKPKPAPPKAKVSLVIHNPTGRGRTSRPHHPSHNHPSRQYMDPIIAATWSEDGAVHDVCKALSPRFREPNAIVCSSANSTLCPCHHICSHRSFSKHSSFYTP